MAAGTDVDVDGRLYILRQCPPPNPSQTVPRTEDHACIHINIGEVPSFSNHHNERPCLKKKNAGCN